jgi:pimeloyl-ACP methyl ester carboxylesterase
VVWAPGTMSHLDLDWEIPQRALFFERFSTLCRLIRFDKRGTGRSDRPVKMARRKLRQRYRWLLRDEIAHIVQDPADVNDEIRYLCAALAESELT